MASAPRELSSLMGSRYCFLSLSEVQQIVTGSYGVEAPILLGSAMSSSAPCLAGFLPLCSFLLFTVWVTPENQLAKVALRGSSVLTQDFRGPQRGCHSGRQAWLNSCA